MAKTVQIPDISSFEYCSYFQASGKLKRVSRKLKDTLTLADKKGSRVAVFKGEQSRCHVNLEASLKKTTKLNLTVYVKSAFKGTRFQKSNFTRTQVEKALGQLIGLGSEMRFEVQFQIPTEEIEGAIRSYLTRGSDPSGGVVVNAMHLSFTEPGPIGGLYWNHSGNNTFVSVSTQTLRSKIDSGYLNRNFGLVYSFFNYMVLGGEEI